ncbi:MAG TPA: Spy/CpxP family protein refolding chaperone [Thermodesulfovibrionales bacterium]|nr:Spy/CpxP family protein refolding chaperone [Thermodesulfovibrionales bacterium]
MKGFSRFSMLALVVCLLALFTGGMVTDSHAYRGKGGDPMMKQLLKGIGLTDQQKAQIKEIIQTHRNELLTGKVAVLQARQNLLAVMTSSTYDKSAVNVAYNTLAVAQQNMADVRAQIFNAVITTVLTPDQQAAVQGRIAAKNQRIQRVIAGLQAKLKTPPLGTQ